MVIPTLDEERHLPTCLDAIGNDPGIEVVLSDGGSTDRTLEIAARRAGVVIIEGPAGRGQQLNRGARIAGSETLLFVHADCILPEGWCRALLAALGDPGVALACFLLHTVSSTHEAPAWRRTWL